jgi:nicotinamidase-related amidase
MSADAYIDGSLLLCMDMQPVFINVIDDGARVLRRCQFAIEAALGLGLRTAFTEQVPQKLGGTASSLLAPTGRDSIVFAKTAFSALGVEGLHAMLRAFNVNQLILCGLETPVCLYQTALAALHQHLQVVLLTDCVGARRPQDSAACLHELTRLGAHALPSETVFYALMQNAEHPFFNGFTKLVKKYG